VSDEREKPIVITPDMLATGATPASISSAALRTAPPLILLLNRR